MATEQPTGPRTFTIDVWHEESIWTWEGTASSTQEAEQAATEQLNEDWERDYANFEALRQDVDGTALMEHRAVMAERQPQAVVDAHEAIADAVREMVAEGRPEGMSQAHYDSIEAALAILG